LVQGKGRGGKTTEKCIDVTGGNHFSGWQKGKKKDSGGEEGYTHKKGRPDVARIGWTDIKLAIVAGPAKEKLLGDVGKTIHAIFARGGETNKGQQKKKKKKKTSGFTGIGSIEGGIYSVSTTRNARPATASQ